jgi:hypothetical protein
MRDEKKIDYSTRSELTDSFLRVFSEISDHDLVVNIDRIGGPRDEELISLSLSIGSYSWNFELMNNEKGIVRAEDMFLPRFRKCMMTFIGHNAVPVKDFERAAASHIRKPELEPWKLMERRIRSTFHVWVTGSGLVRAIVEHHRQQLKRNVQFHLTPLFQELTRQEVIALIGEVYDENLVKEVIES